MSSPEHHPDLSLEAIIAELEAAARQEGAIAHVLETRRFGAELDAVSAPVIAASRRRAAALAAAARALAAIPTSAAVATVLMVMR